MSARFDQLSYKHCSVSYLYIKTMVVVSHCFAATVRHMVMMRSRGFSDMSTPMLNNDVYSDCDYVWF